jgi:valyl-tRNA synthetase
VKSAEAMIHSLAGLEKVTSEKPDGAAVSLRFESHELALSNLADAADAGSAAEAETAMTAKKLAELEKTIGTLEGRLANPGYAERAPAAMVQQTKDQLAKAIAERDALRKS